jgi:nicotinate-nucleotide pyrophosphorylase (carboxylating)
VTPERVVALALAEDLGEAGDITSALLVPADRTATARVVARRPGVLAGRAAGEEVLRQTGVSGAWLAADGDRLEPGGVVAEISGPARAVLTAERTLLNLLCHLSGIATLTAAYVAAAAPATVLDTRKTTPGLRALEKYAVRVGGGFNHRFGLYDAILIKDNHIQAAGGITPAVEAAYAQAPHTMTVTVECDTLAQVEEAIAAGADIVLLDNMSLDMLREAVELLDGQAAAEASGGINEETVTAIAQTGVDIISVGALTHSAIALDISLDLIPL